jgi:hypothetical protein
MTAPTQAQIAHQIGNATRELAPNTSWKYNEPGNSYACLEWLDAPELQPTEAATMAKATELAATELLTDDENSALVG